MCKIVAFILVIASLQFGCDFLHRGAGVNFAPADPPAGWPGSQSFPVGLTDPGSLNPSAGFTVSSDNQVIENLDIDGKLIISASNITVRNCKVAGNIDHAIQITQGSGIIIEHCEIGKSEGNWPNKTKGICINGDNNVTAVIRENYIRYVDDGIFVGSQSIGPITYQLEIRDNYIVYVHSDDGVPGDSIHDHKGDGIEVLGQLDNSLIEHNSINVPSSQTSCILLQANWAALGTVVVSNNWLDGAGFSLYTRKTESTIASTTITGNRFGRTCNFGPWSSDLDGGDTLFLADNRWLDTLDPIDGMN